jgi:type I restriction-modification system DNA methylase subunit
MAQQYIFGDKDIKHRLDDFKLEDIPNLENRRKTITNYIKALESGRIEKTKEEAIQADFLNNFFGDVLGYEYKDSQKWNLEKEHKSQTDTTKADGALGFFAMSDKEIIAEVRAVIELKDALTDLDKPQHRINDKRTPVEQAFSYSSKAGGKCKWVIVSNFIEIRIYHSSDQGAYEKFTLSELTQDENLKRFFYILQKENLISEASESTIEKLYRERQEIEQTITKKFYNDFKTLRLALFNHLKENNKGEDEFLLFNKTQKLLDRFIFVCFAENKYLLPPLTLQKVKDTNKLFFDFEVNKMWRQLKGLFQSIDIGNPPLEINKFNGGLFTYDKEFDDLIVKDDMIAKLLTLSEYNFASDINVNILGHIFEQSLSDIEEIKTQIGNGRVLSHEEKEEVKKNGKRKKEGIFYTPEYITRYIVKEAVGGWLEDRKKELGFYDLPELTSNDFLSVKLPKKKGSAISYNKAIEKHITFWEAYKEKLRNIKVLDPACGSGAFLNQVFDFLYREGQSVNDQLSALRLGQREIFELDKHILTNNIFGVDVNPESVEITKLSLWLKTANKGKELTTLEENIRCGNSLIDDKEIAGDRAFNWFMEFPQVFPFYKDKNKHATDLNKEKIIQSGVLNYPDQCDYDYDDELSEPAFSYKEGSKGFEKYGFDVIIGNPPYVVLSSFKNLEFEYLQDKYKTSFGRLNTFALFIERIGQLLNKNGKSGLIIPDSLCMIDYYANLREFLLKNFNIEQIIELGDGIFEDATVPAIIFLFGKKTVDHQVKIGFNDYFFDTSKYNLTNQDFYTTTAKFSFNLHIDNIFLKLRSLIDNKIYFSLRDVIEIKIGVCTGSNETHIADSPIFANSKKVLFGKNINRFMVSYDEKYLNYDRKELLRARDEQIFLMPEKLLMRQTSDKLILAYDNNQYYTIDSLFLLHPKLDTLNIKYVLAILNSKLLNYQYQKLNPESGRVFAQVKIDYVNELPIKLIDPAAQNPFIEKVEIMLTKSKELDDLRIKFLNFIKSKYAIDSPSSKIQNWIELEFSDLMSGLSKQKIKLSPSDEYELMQLFEKEIGKAKELKEVLAKTDNEIDKMVYKLYDLNEEELAILMDTQSV